MGRPFRVRAWAYCWDSGAPQSACHNLEAASVDLHGHRAFQPSWHCFSSIWFYYLFPLYLFYSSFLSSERARSVGKIKIVVSCFTFIINCIWKALWTIYFMIVPPVLQIKTYNSYHVERQNACSAVDLGFQCWEYNLSACSEFVSMHIPRKDLFLIFPSNHTALINQSIVFAGGIGFYEKLFSTFYRIIFSIKYILILYLFFFYLKTLTTHHLYSSPVHKQNKFRSSSQKN
jgi:hypothetical protein